MTELRLTKSEEKMILDHRAEITRKAYVTHGLELAAQKAELWAKEGCGGNLTDEEIKRSGYYNLAQAIRRIELK